MFKKVFIIAEAGVNHNGSLKIAKSLIDVAAESGADAVKFQTFNAHAVASRFASKALYQKKATSYGGSQLEMLSRLELNAEAHQELIRHCRAKKIMFISSPFDLKSVYLLKELGVSIFKIPSGEITNLPYLRLIGSLRRKVIMSTGMANLKEIKDALDILLLSGTKKRDIVLLHCNTDYPTNFKDVNLLAMLTIKDKLGVQVGYSDHTLGVEVSVAAVGLGARVIEKHFTLNKNLPGPDHQASISPHELFNLVKMVRNVEVALGSRIKEPTYSEKKNLKNVRKSIVASRAIKKGEKFTTGNITVKRPGTGISPMKWDYILGKKSKYKFGPDELLRI